MAKLTYHLESETVLVLNEDGKAGDTLDLKDEQQVDVSQLGQAVQSAFSEKIAQEKLAWEENQKKLVQAQLDQEKQKATFDLEKARQAEKDQAQADKNQLQEQLTELKRQLDKVQSQADLDLEKAKRAEKDQAQAEKAQLLEELATLKSDLVATKKQQESEAALALAQQKEKLQADYQREKDAAQTTQVELEKQLADLNNQVQNQDRDKQLALTQVKTEYEGQLKLAQEQVELYKDFKAKQSTKEIGESLEVYAHQEFDKIRPYAFPNAYFEKDNEVSKESGSKGDFIFRDYQDGVEFISIMFDMKNEADATEKKHRNEDFFKELDKDRREKGTEYAVLVSLLEADNDLYNTGIVQIHDYEKMYVIRPQFFVQFIGLLRNAALNSVQYKKELEVERNQNIDITNFENNINDFKEKFAKNYTSYSNNFQKAIEQIDRTISQMENIKKSLTTSENQIRLANNKLEDLKVDRLTKGNPTMRAKFDALHDD
ncbi:DUF2130 domain-containing protein [Fructobacillus ficulneus]|uniref:DUF2130 domain-containing protein n=1 Tax=Fructobacillus ficulneus TaxID=157463 RepID=A0A0K8MIR5_9LACO|nr:DUF2130 domain-containing protein [Fructobacillus ficulneus]GAP00446.1 hypothetical protein FFIC_284630 [Fructobacillus ficulneus]